MNQCKHLVKLYKHPSNKEPYKGEISEELGAYACLAFQEEGKAVVFTIDDCECELKTKE